MQRMHAASSTNAELFGVAAPPIGSAFRTPTSVDLTDPAPLYRWGWLPLVGGCVVIAGTGIVGSEVLLGALGYAEPIPLARLLFIARAVLVSSMLAAWAGWYVLRTRRRIEVLRQELLQRKVTLETQALRGEQVSGLGALSRILAHEIRSPLNAIAIHCEILRRRAREIDGAAEPLRGVVDALKSETSRLKTLVDDYVAYGGAASVVLRPTATRLEELVASAVELNRDAARERRVVLTVDAPPHLTPAHVDGPKIAQALRLLVRRSLESVGDGGAIWIDLDEEQGRLRVDVTDDGQAFADPAAVFRPFFTEGEPGAAFGLAIAHDIVRAHGGELRATNLEGRKGARITMWLPKEHAS